MCLAIPGRIISFEPDEAGSKMAKADFAGIIKKICIDFLPDVQIGDYVLVHVGFALNKIDEAEALETLNALREVGEAWQEAGQASASE
ncbi:MAG: HypC/HybG/HupF family hydrogenase formation chaperone [candidate division KSB1 bacterium]|nr:HypC/HybG/HupF family hydrogenase formation chaperone [candidate division KSB1 bacterium]